MMFIYIHILFLFSIHGISHHHHLLPQWSIVNRSSSRSVTVSKRKPSLLTKKKDIHASSSPYALIFVCVGVFALFLASFVRVEDICQQSLFLL